MTQRDILLEPGWKEVLEAEFAKPYMIALRRFLATEKKAGKVIYPKGSEIFNALNTTPLETVKVVILGQDPYHQPGQAHGLCFSVPPGVPVPPSLVNIYKEMARDLRAPIPEHGYLRPWADQGVLLLNSVLTVEQGQAASHRDRGWETFTDRVVEVLNQRKEGVIFLLWGSYAQKKGKRIDRNKHLVLQAPHPSPLSAHRGFIGCGHFSQTNAYLQARGQQPIEWPLDPFPCEGTEK